MNSKQLNFYSHPDELKDHLDFLISKGAFLSLEPFRNDYPKFDSSDSLKLNDDIFKIILIKKDDLLLNIHTEFVKEQGYNLFDAMISNVIMFSYPRIKSNDKLIRARFYFVTQYWDNGMLVNKDPEFINWASKLLKDFKKTFLFHKDNYSNEYCTEMVNVLLSSNKIELTIL